MRIVKREVPRNKRPDSLSGRQEVTGMHPSEILAREHIGTKVGAIIDSREEFDLLHARYSSSATLR
jgi:hypothetical protein